MIINLIMSYQHLFSSNYDHKGWNFDDVSFEAPNYHIPPFGTEQQQQLPVFSDQAYTFYDGFTTIDASDDPLFPNLQEQDYQYPSFLDYQDEGLAFLLAAAAEAATITVMVARWSKFLESVITTLLMLVRIFVMMRRRALKKFNVERGEMDTRVNVSCATRPGLLLSTVNTMEALGIEIQQCVISYFSDFSMQASCSEGSAEQRKLISPEDVKQALFRSAGYGGKRL